MVPRKAFVLFAFVISSGCGAGSRAGRTADGPDAAADVAGTGGGGGGDGGASGAGEAGGSICAHCPVYDRTGSLGTIPPVLDELSGLAASHRFAGWFYADNDSSDGPRIFLLNGAAGLEAELDLPGAPTKDIEDVAVGPCPEGTCVYVADIGDNNLDRDDYAIYRAPEPAVLPVAGGKLPLTYERFPFTYPDGAHDAETLLVHPQSGRVFVVVKDPDAPSRVYEMPTPLVKDQPARLGLVATLSVPKSADMVTAGSFHPCGDRLLIRTRHLLFELSLPSSGPPLAGDLVSIFTAPPVEVPVAKEAQGEAVTYALDGLGYYTSGESAGGPQPELSSVDCR